MSKELNDFYKSLGLAAKKEEDNTLKGAVLIAFLVLWVPLILLNGFVLTKLWTWFMVPLGLGPIGIAHGLGLGVIATYFKGPDFQNNDWDGLSSAKVIGRVLSVSLRPLFLLLFGWVFLQFM